MNKVRCCPAKNTHKKGCRPGRPRCRARRGTPCRCLAYHYPHRVGSGLCGHPDRINALVWGPVRPDLLETFGEACHGP